MTTVEEFEDDYDELYEDDEGGVSGFVILLIGLIILTLFGIIVYFAYQSGLRDRDNLPVIAADPSPSLTEQEITIASSPREQEVFDTLEGTTPSKAIVDANSEKDPLEGFSETTSAAEQAGEGLVSVSTEKIANIAGSMADKTDPAKDTSIAETSAAPVSVPPEATPKPTPKPQPAVTPTPVTGRATHVVQVGAFRSDVEADGFFTTMNRKYSTLMQGKVKDVERADLGERGIYYRLRIGPFTSSDAAKNWCNDLKAQGQDCLVKGL
ncbi:MAG: SPOR domain-containing protein [bacterium]